MKEAPRESESAGELLMKLAAGGVLAYLGARATVRVVSGIAGGVKKALTSNPVKSTCVPPAHLPRKAVSVPKQVYVDQDADEGDPNDCYN